LKDFVIEFLSAIERTVYLFLFLIEEQALKIYDNRILRSMFRDQERVSNSRMKKNT
jgi:hypothetical protein